MLYSALREMPIRKRFGVRNINNDALTIRGEEQRPGDVKEDRYQRIEWRRYPAETRAGVRSFEAVLILPTAD